MHVAFACHLKLVVTQAHLCDRVGAQCGHAWGAGWFGTVCSVRMGQMWIWPRTPRMRNLGGANSGCGPRCFPFARVNFETSASDSAVMTKVEIANCCVVSASSAGCRCGDKRSRGFKTCSRSLPSEVPTLVNREDFVSLQTLSCDVFDEVGFA